MSKGECVTYFVERFLAGRIWEWSEEEDRIAIYILIQKDWIQSKSPEYEASRIIRETLSLEKSCNLKSWQHTPISRNVWNSSTIYS